MILLDRTEQANTSSEHSQNKKPLLGDAIDVGN